MWFEKHSHRRSKVCVWNTEEQTNIKECKRNIWKEHVLPKTRVAKHSKSHLFWKGNFLIFSVIAFPKKANMAWFEYAYFSLRCNTRVWIIQKKEKGKVGATCQFSWLEMLHLHLLICWAVQCRKVFVKAIHLLSLRCLDVHLASPLNCLSFFCVTAEVDSESGMDFFNFPFFRVTQFYKCAGQQLLYLEKRSVCACGDGWVGGGAVGYILFECIWNSWHLRCSMTQIFTHIVGLIIDCP